MKSDAIFWFHTGPFPVDLGLCLTEPAWTREMRRRGAEWTWPTELALTSQIAEEPLALLVTLDLQRFSDMTNLDRIVTVVHEAQHVWQFTAQHVLHAAQEIDDELAAYCVQWITKMLLERLVALQLVAV